MRQVAQKNSADSAVDNPPPGRVDTPCIWCSSPRSKCTGNQSGQRGCCPDCHHPQRLQRRRVKGFHLPDSARSVARPSRYGNPFRVVGRSVVGMCWPEVTEWDRAVVAMPDVEVLYACAPDRCAAVERAVVLYRQLVRFRQSNWSPARFDSWLQPVRRCDLACYCALDQPCHADVLLEIAGGLS
ncbi:DUF4326 domain-containing protein [Mycolicibacterium fortuitum]|uniref:DUF4326 domain-containing protein n=1 Tax=Mycolicibacterium fortuitum TaxID=1766 RepID=UPI0009BF9B73|nr:DUF4326 domain-containing protein [Mycolicibacterium fortuitum]